MLNIYLLKEYMNLNVYCIVGIGQKALQMLFYLFLTTDLQAGYSNLYFTGEEIMTPRVK